MPMLDCAKTEALVPLLATPRAARDAAWRSAFFEVIVDASLVANEPQVIAGPDGFPYFALQRPPAETARTLTPCSMSQILEHCTENGFGIVIEATESGPQWVFTYGDLFAFRAYRSFAGDPIDLDALARPAAPTEIAAAGSEVMLGSPSEEMLPKWARRTLARHLRESANIATPSVFLMVRPSHRPGRDLLFNLHPEDFPSIPAFQAALDRIGWFLPRGRSVSAISRASDLTQHFVPLIESPA
jgi:hypothetical protein